MHNRTFITILASITSLTACQLDPKDLGTPDSAGGSTDSAGADPSTSATETAPATDGDDSGATDPGTGASDPTVTATDTGASDPTVTATDTGASDPTVTATATDTGATDGDDTDTGGAQGCGAPEPAAAADFAVTLDAWPGQSDEEHDVERACTIDAVNSGDDTVTTLLTCDVDGVPLGASLELAAAPEGAVDWAVGQAVTLRSRVFNDEFEGDVRVRMTLVDDPGVLLVDGQMWWGDGVPESQQIGPLLRERMTQCVPRLEDVRYTLKYSLADASVTIMSGGRGALPVDAAHTYAIDLAFSGTDCCHGSEHSLIRRVKP